MWGFFMDDQLARSGHTNGVLADDEARPRLLAGAVQEAGALHDVLSFLGRTRWRGELLVESEAERRSLFFDEGYVVGAESTAERERLGAVLCDAGVITREQVTACETQRGDRPIRFGEVAVELGILSPQALFRAMVRQIEAVFSAVLNVAPASFVFLGGFDEAFLSCRHKCKVPTLLRAAIAGVQDIRWLRARIPSSAHVVARAPDVRAPATDPDGIYAATDGRRSVGELASLTWQSPDEVGFLRALCLLVQAGHVTIEPPRLGAARIVEVYNDAIKLLLVELDAMDEGETVREHLAKFAERLPEPLAGLTAADDGTFDAAAVATSVAAAVSPAEAEEALSSWLYDYASFALFLARPHLARRDEGRPPRDIARVSKRVEKILGMIAPSGRETRIPDSVAPPPEGGLVEDVPGGPPAPRITVPIAAGPASERRAFPGVDPSRTVRMSPVTEEMLIRRAAEKTIAPQSALVAAPAAGSPAVSPQAPPHALPHAPPVVVAPNPVVPPARGVSPRISIPTPLAVGAGLLFAATVLLAGIGLLRGTDRPASAMSAGESEILTACEPECESILVDGLPAVRANGTFRVAPGRHEVVASKPGYGAQIKHVVLSSGERRAVPFVLTRAEAQAVPADRR